MNLPTIDNDDDIGESEVWVKFSATHHYEKTATGEIRYISSDYFRIDPFGIEALIPISKDELIKALEPDT